MPSLSLRIDAISPRANGMSYVAYSSGATLGSPMGKAVETSIATLNAALADVNPDDLLILLLFAAWRRVNPALNNPSLVIGRVITINPDAPANIVTIA